MESPIYPNETTVDREELAALRRDAERYRTLRAPVTMRTIHDIATCVFAMHHRHEQGSIPSLDVAIGDELDALLDRRIQWSKS